MIEAQVLQLKAILKAIDKMDQAIKDKYRRLDDPVIFELLPGARPQLAPRLLVAFGSRHERFELTEDIQKYASVAPVIEQSGKKK